MKTIFKIFVRITDGLTNVSGWLAALCLLGAALIVTEAVIARKLYRGVGVRGRYLRAEK